MDEMLSAGRLRRLRDVNERFHMTLYKAAETRRLYAMIVSLWTQFPWDTLWVIPDRAQRSVKEHQGILEAIQKRDGDMAAERIKQHVESARASVVAYIAKADAPISDMSRVSRQRLHKVDGERRERIGMST